MADPALVPPDGSAYSRENSAIRRPLPDLAGPEARELAKALGLSTTVADLLLRRGHQDLEATRRFLDPKLLHLTRPDGMADRDIAADRLARAVRQRERICVFGDYDCDGITATAVTTEILTQLGGDVVPVLASRYAGGYGLSSGALGHISETGARLLVTCDCGSSDHESLEQLRRQGIDAIVIDHHLVPEDPLPALAFLNPQRKDCGFPYKSLASCGLALSLGAAVRAALGQNLDLRRSLDLVAIGTIADVVPLDGDNRALVRAGLRMLEQARRPGVRALLELAKVDPGSSIGGEDVAFRIAPRINAPGRLGPPDAALKLLLARSDDSARGLAAEIEQLMAERRALQERVQEEAVAEIEEAGWGERASIVVGRAGWSQGVVGIVAGRLAERYQRPAIVVGFEGEHGRGSVRGPKGSRLHTALSAAAHAVTRFGGHQAAAGLDVELSRLGELREAFEAACSQGLAAPLAPSPDAETNLVARFAPEDDPFRVLLDLTRLEPCGEKNPTPRLCFESEVVAAREVTGGHLKLELELDRGRRISGFGPMLGERAKNLSGRVTVLGKLRPDRWRGGEAVELCVEEVS
jgi:single-stranded-DNA-specific exonuclease